MIYPSCDYENIPEVASDIPAASTWVQVVFEAMEDVLTDGASSEGLPLGRIQENRN